jgi:hypothetical protein
VQQKLAGAAPRIQSIAHKLNPKPSVGIGEGMCQSCVEIDQQVDGHRELLRSTTDPAEIERIKRLIAKLYGDRLRLHKSPER